MQDSAASFSLGVLENKILLSYRAHLSDIFTYHADIINAEVKNLALKADELDNFFMKSYSCEMAMEAKNEA